jgi:RNA polymerase sigma-70 factor (ECF subfamily)
MIWMMTDIERPTIELARAGDDAACQQIVDQHREAIFRLAYLILGDADDAEDVAQESFIRALRYLHRYDPERPLRPWLLRITANLARNRRRSFGRYWAALKRAALESPTPVITPETKSAAAIEAEALWRAVRCLKAHEQEVIYLRYFLELPVNETAEALNVQPGTVKSRLHRALINLRTVIERDYPELSEAYDV